MKANAESATRDPCDWPLHGLESLSGCPICRSKQKGRLYVRLTDRTFQCAPGKWTLYQCRDCDTAYLDPRPTVDTMHLAYQDYYTHVRGNSLGVSPKTSVQRVRQHIARRYISHRYKGDETLVGNMVALALALLPMFRRRIDRRMRYLPTVYPGAQVLDIGFGDAVFLEEASKVGWKGVGVDSDPINVANARKRNLNVRLGDMKSFIADQGSFDVVTISHVIEHVHDPRGTLETAYALLKPGGMLYIDTPNIESLGHRKFGAHWRGLEPPRHLAIFSWTGIEGLLCECGFLIDSRKPRYEMYPGMAAKSRAIRNGKDPYREEITLSDRIEGARAYVASMMNYRNSEFVTIVAKRPTSAV